MPSLSKGIQRARVLHSNLSNLTIDGAPKPQTPVAFSPSHAWLTTPAKNASHAVAYGKGKNASGRPPLWSIPSEPTCNPVTQIFCRTLAASNASRAMMRLTVTLTKRLVTQFASDYARLRPLILCQSRTTFTNSKPRNLTVLRLSRNL